MRNSLTMAGITESVCDIVEKYTGEFANMTEEER